MAQTCNDASTFGWRRRWRPAQRPAHQPSAAGFRWIATPALPRLRLLDFTLPVGQTNRPPTAGRTKATICGGRVMVHDFYGGAVP